MSQEQPLNPLPPVVIVLALAIFGVELVLSLAANGLIGGDQGIGWRLAAMERFGFAPAVLDWIVTRGDYSPEVVQRFLTYAFVQPSFVSAIFAGVMVLALGKFVGEVFSATATLAVFCLSSVVGALVFGLVLSGTVPLLGAFPGVYGLIGAYTYILWLRLGQMGEAQIQAFRLIGVLLGIQLIFGLLFGPSPTWIAELTGFAAGFASSTLLAPGGFAALVARMRQRR